MTEPELKLAAIEVLTLQNLEDIELIALNNAVQAFGRVPPANLAFTKAVELKLIKPDGSLWEPESIKRACEHEVLRRFPQE